jgi:hypothetical protein
MLHLLDTNIIRFYKYKIKILLVYLSNLKPCKNYQNPYNWLFFMPFL